MVDLAILSYGELIGGTALAITVVNTLWSIYQRIVVKGKTDAGFEEVARESKMATVQIRFLSEELAAHKMLVATKYVGIDMLERVEARLFTAIADVTSALRDMTGRLDRVLDRRIDPQ